MTNGEVWYDPLAHTNTVTDPLVTNRADLRGHEDWRLRRGQGIENWDESAWLASSDAYHDGEPDDVLQCHLWLPIYSGRLRLALDAAGIRGIQYLPIHVCLSDGTPIKGFAIANILNSVEALDRERSKYEVYPEDYFLPERRGDVRGLRIPVLRREVIVGLDIFRLKEYEVSFFVSQRFKDVFEGGQFTGYTFDRVVPLS